jgi:hypothetical protein
MFNITFNNISIISGYLVLIEEDEGLVPGENRIQATDKFYHI